MLFKRMSLMSSLCLMAACGGRDSVEDPQSRLATFTVGRYVPKAGDPTWKSLELSMERKDKPNSIKRTIDIDKYSQGEYKEISTRVEAGDYRIKLLYSDASGALLYQSCKENPNEIDRQHQILAGETYRVKIMICDVRTGKPTGEVEAKDLADVEITPEAVGGSSSNGQQQAQGTPALLRNAKFWVDPNSLAMNDARLLRSENNPDARYVEFIAQQPAAVWYAQRWSGESRQAVSAQMRSANAEGAMAVMVLYDVPGRDCNQYSAGGQPDGASYRRWIDGVVEGIGNGKAMVILEPDALPQIDIAGCLTQDQKQERKALLRYAVSKLKAKPNTLVYLDAGHSNWMSAEQIAPHLRDAGIDMADGFALNTSNYTRTEDNINFGTRLSGILGGKRFVIDTSRNGNGPKGDLWCNPRGRALGKVPTTQTGNPLVDAFIWTKRPGESDGSCVDGNDYVGKDSSVPKAGDWWRTIAIEQARNAGI